MKATVDIVQYVESFHMKLIDMVEAKAEKGLVPVEFVKSEECLSNCVVLINNVVSRQVQLVEGAVANAKFKEEQLQSLRLENAELKAKLENADGDGEVDLWDLMANENKKREMREEDEDTMSKRQCVETVGGLERVSLGGFSASTALALTPVGAIEGAPTVNPRAPSPSSGVQNVIARLPGQI